MGIRKVTLEARWLSIEADTGMNSEIKLIEGFKFGSALRRFEPGFYAGLLPCSVRTFALRLRVGLNCSTKLKLRTCFML